MDAMTLLDQAQAAGLSVKAAGDKLVIKGPRSAEALAQQLLEHKTELMAILSRSSHQELLCSGHIWDSPCVRGVPCSRCGTPSLCPDCGGCRLCWLRSKIRDG